MKRLFIPLFLCLTLQSAFTQDLYDPENLTTIEITFPESNWDQILDNLMAAGEEERHLGTVVINGVSFDSVGIRYKGNSSYRPDNKKNPLNLKLDHIIENQDYDGYGTIKLANGFKDPTFIRETLSYEIARKYMPSSNANYADVYINGSRIGLYTSVQSVDKFFLGNHFAGNDNTFVKGEITKDGPKQDNSIWGFWGSDSASYTGYYEMRSDYGWSDLIGFLDTLNNVPERIGDVINIDRHLWMLAFDILMVNLDAPVNFAHNYYLYRDNSGRFNPAMWDLNENFGVFTNVLSNNLRLSTSDMVRLDPFFQADNDKYIIINRFLNDPELRRMYIAHMKTMIKENFSNDWFLDRAEELQDIIDADIKSDNNFTYAYDQFKLNLHSTIGGGFPGPGGSTTVGIEELMDARIDYLNTLSEFTAVAPVIGEVAMSPETAAPNGEVQISVAAEDVSRLYLYFREGETSIFERVEMTDDGSAGDVAAGDGIYGAVMPTGTLDISYYFYADNSEAGSFLPARAAYEFFTLPVSGTLVINELLAGNDAAAADQDGEFDDWIELYNSSESDINLSGYYLSDKTDNLKKWVFPDTTIEPSRYLVIWADEDGSQTGLHANFKLSSAGETVTLSNSNEMILDQVVYSAQRTDISYGRTPNGTGPFSEMTPTIGSGNQGTTAIDDQTGYLPDSPVLEQNYPNPFNPETTITYTVPFQADITLTVYNSRGQEVETLIQSSSPPGTYTCRWNAAGHPSGLYLYMLKIDTAVEEMSMCRVRKMLLLK